MKSLAYAGIGSRETPADVQELMKRLACRLRGHGYTLRTGGAVGADTAFMSGCDDPDLLELYLPWPEYNGLRSCRRARADAIAVEIAQAHHPAWSSLSRESRLLLARSTHLILGADCASPCRFVICWTPDGAETMTSDRSGGTGQAIRIAIANWIPVWNLAIPLRRRLAEEDLASLTGPFPGACEQCEAGMTPAEEMLGPVCGRCCRENHRKARGR